MVDLVAGTDHREQTPVPRLTPFVDDSSPGHADLSKTAKPRDPIQSRTTIEIYKLGSVLLDSLRVLDLSYIPPGHFKRDI